MGTGPPAMTEIDSECVGTELNRQSPKAGGLRPLELTNAQPTQMKSLTRVGVEPTKSRRFELRRFAGLRTASCYEMRPRGDLNP